jgi:hypothetical protein
MKLQNFIPYKLELRPFIVNCNAKGVTIYLFYSLNTRYTGSVLTRLVSRFGNFLAAAPVGGWERRIP